MPEMGKALRRDASFERILVVVTRQIGDVLLTTPLIQAARIRWPGAAIDVLGFAGTLGVLKGNAHVCELIEVPPGAGWWSSVPLILRLWRRYDLALVAQYSDRAHLYGWVSAPVRSGQVPKGRKGRWKRAMLQHSVELGSMQSHMVLEKLKLLSPWVDTFAPPVVVPPSTAGVPEKLANRLSSSYVVMQVPSLVQYKQWPKRYYVDLAGALARRGLQVVLTGGPSVQDRQIVAEVEAACASSLVVNAVGALDFHQLTGLIGGSALYIGPDTSITHLASACGVPVIALFGPIDPTWWGPWPASWPASQPYQRRGPRQKRGNVVLLQGTQSCVPCNGAGCDKHPESRSECLETLEPERVFVEALAWLEKG